MDKRLIPPSHFDVSDDADMESLRTGQDSIRVPLSQNGNALFLKTPEDFEQMASRGNAEVVTVGSQRPHNLPRGILQGGERDRVQFQGHYIHSPSLPILPDKYSELLKLKAENDALHALLNQRRRQLEDEVCEQTRVPRSHAQQAVIEHQLQHIARLQSDLDSQTSLVTKRDSEILQSESAIARKQEEIKELRKSVEVAHDELQQKEEIIQLKSQQVLALESEIGELKSQSEMAAADHTTAVKALQDKLEEEKDALAQFHNKQSEDLLNKHADEIQSLRQEMVLLKEAHDHQIEKLMQTHQREKLDWEHQVRKVEDSSLEKVESFKIEASNASEKHLRLERILEQETAAKQALQSDLLHASGQLSLSQANAEKQTVRVAHLEAYIGELRTEDYQRSQWKNERTKYEEDILALQNEKQSLTKTMELQDIRLQSITKILTTQEDTINASTKAFSTGSKIGGLAPAVIRKWREKVLELMVRIKSKEIESRNLENQRQILQSDLQEQFEDEKRVCIILENQLAESRASLEIKQTEIGQLSSKLATVSHRVEALQSKLSDAENGAATMAENVEKSVGNLDQLYHSTMTKMTEKLIHMEQRLGFATNRMKTLQDLYTRRENILRAQLKRQNERSSVTELDSSQQKESSWSEKRPDLIAEIDRLTEERDSLSHRLSKDSALFDSATAQFKSQEAKLLNDVTTLQHEVQNKSEEIADLKRRVTSLEDTVQDRTKEASDVNDRLRDVLQTQKNTVENKLDEAWNRWNVEKKNLLHKLEESQREHAKTVVNSRQIERASTREKKRLEENLEAFGSQHKTEIASLKSRIKSLKVDNNLLMTTLRQQGLVNTYKAARKEARDAQRPSPSETRRSHSAADVSLGKKRSSPTKALSSMAMSRKESDKHCEEKPDSAISGTNIEGILQDLVVMTESILDDSV